MTVASDRQSEFVLDPAIVGELLRTQFSSLAATSITYLHEGWDSVAYLVNGEWVFRFPKRRERQEWLNSETAVLGLLGRRRLPLSMPHPTYFGQPGTLFPCAFVGYRMIAGTQGDVFDIRSVNRTTNARKLGEFLATLHSIDIHEAAARGVKSFEWPLEDELVETVKLSETVYPMLSADLKPLCQPFLDGTCVIPQIPVPRKCLVHGDLEDEHILLDEGGRVSGLIDWGDSGLSDPATDFRGLYAWLGENFVREVLGHYGCASDSSILDQITFRARCNALITYGHWLQGRGTSRADRLQMVHTAFGVHTPELNEVDREP